MSDYDKALGYALRLINFRWRTVAELKLKLTEREIAPEVIDKVVQFLLEKDFLNDKRFATSWIRYRGKINPRSKYVINRELQAKGVSEEDIRQVFDNWEPDEAELVDEVSLAVEAGRRKLRTYKSLDDASFRNKMTGFLGRKGFNYSVIKGALAILGNER